MLYYYQSVMRPVIEYASPLWQTSLTKKQTKQLEDAQRRALQVIFVNIPYDEARRACDMPSLAERRHEFDRFFQSIIRDTETSQTSSASQAQCLTNDSTASF